MAWNSRHYTVVGAFLAALAAQLSGVTTWEAVRLPSFWAGLIGQMSALIGALYVNSPSRPPEPK